MTALTHGQKLTLRYADPAKVAAELDAMGTRPLHVIALEISATWSPCGYAAAPYLEAMHNLTAITDRYGQDDARTVVMYFLSNAKSWRGAPAQRIKAELRSML